MIKQKFRKIKIKLIDLYKVLRWGKVLTLNYKGLKLNFSLDSKLSRYWFLPRYQGGNVHEPMICDILEGFAKRYPDGIFFDVGANVGFFTVLGSGYFKSVHSFEMDPRLVSIIKEHFNYNLILEDKNIFIVNAAIMDQTKGNVSFSPSIEDELVQELIHAINKVDVVKKDKICFYPVSLSLGDYINNNEGPNILKMDIEGAEYFALKGMEDYIEKELPSIILEIHPANVKSFGGDFKDILTKFKSLGYVLYCLDHRIGKTIDQELIEKQNLNAVIYFTHPNSKNYYEYN